MPFLLPALVINIVIILIPALLTVAMAFVEWDGVSTPTFVGLDNFRTIFADPVFFSALLNNIKWTLIFLIIPIAMGLVAGSLLLVVRRGRTFFQIVYFLPVIIATVVVARVWQGMIYNPESGLVGWLKLYGVALSDPLANPPTALYAVASVDVWHWWGFLAVIFFAALRQVDMAQIDAAMLDGANFPQLMRYVLLPAIRPTITLMMIMTVIWSFLAFDFVYVLTQGGPAYSSEVLSTLSYRYAFYNYTVGPAAAVALVISFFGLVATVFYVRIQQREGAR
ncbi:carbohydrate ABC transporter permease [Methylocapsa sp. S129]|uniref:carbohydrate ABC transporter permease n=1 Tax=Methylocapsa sp. S129 TaxID=1641869 RepID=UPI00352A7A75